MISLGSNWKREAENRTKSRAVCLFCQALFAFSLLIVPLYVGLFSSQKPRSFFWSLHVSGTDVDWRLSNRWSATCCNSVKTCCGVYFASIYLLHRGLSDTPIVNRCLFRGQFPVWIPMTFLGSFLFSLIRLRAGLIDTSGTALFVGLCPSASPTCGRRVIPRGSSSYKYKLKRLGCIHFRWVCATLFTSCFEIVLTLGFAVALLIVPTLP